MGCGASKNAGPGGAKPGKKGAYTSPALYKDIKPLEMKPTEVEGLDTIFTKAADIANNLAMINAAMKGTMNALRLLIIEGVKIFKQAGKYIIDLIKEFIKTAFVVEPEKLLEGQSPISINWEAIEALGIVKAIEAAKAAFVAMTTTIVGGTVGDVEVGGILAVITNVQEIQETVKGYATDPASLKTEIEGAVDGVMAVMKSLKAAKSNISSVGDLPEMLDTLKATGAQMCAELKDIFEPSVDKALEQAVVESLGPGDKTEIAISELSAEPMGPNFAMMVLVLPLYKAEEVAASAAKIKESGKFSMSEDGKKMMPPQKGAKK